MTRYLLSVVASSALADAPGVSLNKLSRDQLAGVGDSFKRSRNTTALNQFMDKIENGIAITLANQMSASPHNLTRNVRVNLVQALIKKLGEPATWSSSDIKNIGGELLKGLRPRDVSKMADKSRFSFESLADALLDKTNIPRSLSKTIGDAARTLMGDPIKWDQEAVGRYAMFTSPKDLKAVRPDSVLGALDKLAKLNGIRSIQARELVIKLKHSTAFGSIDQWKADKIKRLGQLAHGLTIKDISNVSPSSVVRDSMEQLGKINLTIAQAKEFIKHILNVDPANQWSADYLRKTGYLAKGIGSSDLKRMKKETVDGALETLKTICNELSLEQIRNIADNIDDTSKWTNQKASTIGNLCYGKTAEQLKKIPVNAIEGLMKNMSPRSNNLQTQKRSLKSAFFQLSSVNLTKAGPICSVLTLNDLTNTNINKELGLGNLGNVTWLPWQHDQAILFVQKIKALKGEPHQWSEYLVRSLSERSLLRGLSRKDIGNIHLSNFTLEEFSNDKDLLSGQKEAIIKEFALKPGFHKASLGAIESMGGILIEARKYDLERMSRDIATQAVRQIGAIDVTGRPFDWIKQKLRTAMKILGKDVSSQLTSIDIIQLGNLVCGLTSSEINDIKNDVFDDIMNFIGERTCFDASQLKALAEKAKNVFKKDGSVEDVLPRMTGNELHEIGCIVEGFSPSDLRNLSLATIKDNVNFLGMRNWTADQAKGLIERLTSSQRKRRDIDVSKKKAAELVAMGNLLKGLSPSDIITINYLEYDDVASAVGNIDGFTREQLEAWATKAKQAWSNSGVKVTSSQLLTLGGVAIGFKDFSSMDLTTGDVIESLGSQKVQAEGVVGYTSSQLKSALSRIISLKKKLVDQFTGDEISNLNNFAVAMTTSEIDTIHTSTFKNCIGSLGRLTGWSHDQMKALKKKYTETHGPVDKWTTAQVREAGTIIGGLSDSELQSLTDEQIAMVTPDAIKSIPASLFKKFTSYQLEQFDSTQAAAVTSEQFKELPEESQDVLMRKTGHKSESQPISGAYCQKSFILLTAGLCTAVVKIILNHPAH